jgi:hypothetical protein
MNTSKERKINIVDLLFVIFILAVLVFGALKFASFGSSQPASATKVVYTLEVRNTFPELTGYVKEGDKVFDDESMKEIGVVTEITKKNATILAENTDDGTMTLAEIKDRFNVEIKVTADGTVSSGNASVNSVNLLIGKSMECIVGDAYVNAVITDVGYEDVTETKEAMTE